MDTIIYIWSECYRIVVSITVDKNGHPVDPNRVSIFYVPGAEDIRDWEI